MCKGPEVEVWLARLISREARTSGAEIPRGRMVGTEVRGVIWGRQIMESLGGDFKKCIYTLNDMGRL